MLDKGIGLNIEEIREAFPDLEVAVNEQLRKYESARAEIEDETRFDFFCLPELAQTDNEREWLEAFMEAKFDLQTGWIDKRLHDLKNLLPLECHSSASSGGVTQYDIERARRAPCQNLLNHRECRVSGKNIRFLCPFHSDHHPSFSINTELNRWKCWSQCGISGNSIDLYIRLHNVDFVTAVRALNR